MKIKAFLSLLALLMLIPCFSYAADRKLSL